MALVSPKVVSDRRQRIVDFMEENRAFWKSSEIARELELTPKTAANDFRALQKQGTLVKKESSDGNRYRLHTHSPRFLADAGSPEFLAKTNLGSVAKEVAAKVETPTEGPDKKTLPTIPTPQSFEKRLREAKEEALYELLNRLPPSLVEEIRAELENREKSHQTATEIVGLITDE
jgi:Mn-dependent DtxR family transcriptional regulator